MSTSTERIGPKQWQHKVEQRQLKAEDKDMDFLRRNLNAKSEFILKFMALRFKYTRKWRNYGGKL